MKKGRLKYSVPSIEYMHLVKVGNNVKSMAAGRQATDPELLARYRAIVDAKPQPYRNPLFRAGLLTSLLDRQPWHAGMSDMLLERPWPFFIRCPDTPKSMPWFAADAAAKFQHIYTEHQNALEDFETMSKTNDDPGDKPKTPLALLIHRLIRNYVQRKTEERSGIKWDDFKGKKVKDEESGREGVDIPAPYREAKEKIASDTFLAMRARRDQDFADYFTARICSVGQFLREDEFATVAEALLDNPGEVKTLTLLALSANS
jgi:CRISPR-associated protein Cmx8